MVHDCTDALTQLSHVNTDLEQNRCNHISYCLDNQYQASRKNVPADSQFTKKNNEIMRVTANKKLFSTSKTFFQSCNSSFKNSKNLRLFPQNPENRNQNGYENKTGQYEKQYSSNHSSKNPK